MRLHTFFQFRSYFFFFFYFVHVTPTFRMDDNFLLTESIWWKTIWFYKRRIVHNTLIGAQNLVICHTAHSSRRFTHVHTYNTRTHRRIELTQKYRVFGAVVYVYQPIRMRFTHRQTHTRTHGEAMIAAHSTHTVDTIAMRLSCHAPYI